jgi:murein DD-endopeptidase MepM/ murein hydrolase activator NlpD
MQRPAKMLSMKRAVHSTLSRLAPLLLVLAARGPVLLAAQPEAAKPANAAKAAAFPTSVRQGEFFIARVSGAAGASGSCQWMGKTYSLRPNGDNLEAILAVPMTTPAGKGTARIALDNSPGPPTLALHVRIVKRRFGIQRLTMKKQTLALYSAPGVEDEYRAIRAALATESADRFWQEPFVQPCSGRIATSFGLHRIINRKDGYRHRGVDLAAPRGTPVVASNAGIVTLAREDFALHGRTVIIDHGQGVSSLYIHLDSIAVSEGQGVQRGEVIGAVGDSGAATGPHVHWAFYIHDICVDPFAVVKFHWPAPSP